MSKFQLKDQTCLIDDEDTDLLENRWRLQRSKNSNVYYVMRSIYSPKRATLALHRLILQRVLNRDLVKGEEVDHKNRIGTDNRRENLRLASSSQNGANKILKKDNTSGYKGVFKHRNKWQAQIRVNGKDKYLGLHETPELAHAAYIEEAVKQFGEFARE